MTTVIPYASLCAIVNTAYLLILLVIWNIYELYVTMFLVMTAAATSIKIYLYAPPKENADTAAIINVTADVKNKSILNCERNLSRSSSS